MNNRWAFIYTQYSNLSFNSMVISYFDNHTFLLQHSRENIQRAVCLPGDLHQNCDRLLFRQEKLQLLLRFPARTITVTIVLCQVSYSSYTVYIYYLWKHIRSNTSILQPTAKENNHILLLSSDSLQSVRQNEWKRQDFIRS